MDLGEGEVVCRGCHRISSAEADWCAGCARRLRHPAPVAPPPAPGRSRICPRCRRGNPEDAEVCFDCGGRFTGSVARPVVEPKPETAPGPLPCPGCGTEMERGVMFLQNSSFWGRLLADGPIDPVVFRRDKADHHDPVIRPGEQVQAQRCPACNSVWIAPPPPRETSW